MKTEHVIIAAFILGVIVSKPIVLKTTSVTLRCMREHYRRSMRGHLNKVNELMVENNRLKDIINKK